MKNLHVKCDLCDFRLRIETPGVKQLKVWHHAPCPICGRGEIITNADIFFFRCLRMMEIISNVIGALTLHRMKKIHVIADTAGGELKLRKKD